jgi:hypothetical protein
MGEPIIIPSSIVTLVVHLKLSKMNEPDAEPLKDEDNVVEEEEPMNREWWVNQDTKSPSAHTPFFPDVTLFYLMDFRPKKLFGG